MTAYDLVVLGGGAAGFAAAIRADERGARTAMINGGLPLGGTCVNVGCVPSKRLLHAAEVLKMAAAHGVPGLDLRLHAVDFAALVADEAALVDRLRREKYDTVLRGLDHVTFIEGRASFASPHEIEVGSTRLRAEHAVIATGSTATVPPIPGLDRMGFLTHVEALRLARAPERLAIIGAGPLGVEFAQLYARFGTAVTLLQRGPGILPRAERELADRLAEALAADGVTIHTGVTITGAACENGMKVLHYSMDGRPAHVAADEILLAAGKTPNTRDLGLDRVGVRVDDRHAVIVDRQLRTSRPHIFAAGDVARLPLRLETTAGREGTLAADNALSGSQRSIDYRAVPYAVFTDPQLAGVGWTEEEEMTELGTCACRTISLADVPKAHILGRTEGLIKIVIHPETHEIAGVHILSPGAGDLIAQAMTLVANKNTIEDVIESVPMFPTLSEGIRLAALAFTRDISRLSCCT